MARKSTNLSYDHGLAAEPLIGRTLCQQLEKAGAENPDREAVVSFSQDIRYTYSELVARIDSLARGFMSLGIQIGDRLAIWSANNMEWVITQFAAAKVGAILVNVNPAYRKDELEYVLKQSGTKVLVMTEGFKGNEYLDIAGSLAPGIFDGKGNQQEELPDLEAVVLIGVKAHPASHAWGFEEVIEKGNAVSKANLEARASSLQFDDAANIQYTSGTTGSPKGVTLSHHNLLNNAVYAAWALGLKPGSRFCVPMPFYHCGGMVTGTLVSLLVGGTLVIPGPQFDPEVVLSAIHKERCTHLCGVPTMFIAQLEHPRFAEFDLSSMTSGFMAGAPCPVQLMREVADKMHIEDLVIFYGLTECSPLITTTTVEDSLEIRATTVGKAIWAVEVKIIDPATGEVLERGKQGEICARGYAVMLGYWGNPDATADAIDGNGWLRTGDLGVMNEDGYVNITGRAKDMIIRGGENIYPREIEELLHHHPQISQGQVFGIPDLHLGEEVALWVKLKDDAESLEAAEIQEWLKERVAHFKVPKHVKIVTDFPMTVTGKVQKFMMREAMVEELGLEKAASVKTA